LPNQDEAPTEVVKWPSAVTIPVPLIGASTVSMRCPRLLKAQGLLNRFVAWLARVS
jgi:hypothetical protein